MAQKFYRCSHCGQIITKVDDKGVPVICCGEPMNELVPGTTDGAHEKHVPVYEVSGNKVTVKVGEIEHPMIPEHYIQWIAITTNMGTMLKKLSPEEKPEAEFMILDSEEVLEVFEYCNLHGLWKK